MSDVVIILQTYQRTAYALRTIQAAERHLKYKDGTLFWYIADDGSEPAHVAELERAILNTTGPDSQWGALGAHTEKLGYGASANKAWRAALERSAFSLWLEDDWELSRDLDLTPYVRLLAQHDDVGMVRLGHLAIDLDCRTVGYDGVHYLNILPTTNYQFSGNPSLRHRRFWEAFGEYPEGLNPGNTEIAYDAQIRNVGLNTNAPRIVWPVDLGGWGVFAHIGEVKSYA